MKYIVKFHHTETGFTAMYMIACREWTRSISEATIHNDRDGAINLAETQYPHSDDAWNYMTILEYTDQEYFKAVLKG